MKINKSIMYFGQATWGSTSLQRYNALSEIFNSSYMVDSRRAFPDKKSGRTILKSIQGRLGFGNILSSTSKIIYQEALRFKPDIIWVDGGFLVTKKVINSLKELDITMVHYTPDSISAPGMSNLCFKSAISAYNFLITTKTQDINLYNKYKAKNIIFSQQGYDPEIHSKVSLTANDLLEFGCDVAFIGHCMKHRMELMEFLLNESDFNIKIYGTGWNNRRASNKLKNSFQGPAIDINYAKAINGSKISLGLLNHEAKDQITTRSFEIPSSGGFLLAERTDQHIEILKEGIDASYFSSKEELLSKVKYYLRNEDDRLKIKENGYLKIREGKYSWKSLIINILNEMNLELK